LAQIRSSFNALRHGPAAAHRRQHAPAAAVERLAQAICGDQQDGLYSAARAIAENEFVLSAIRQQKIVVIERLKEATAIALRKGDNSLTLAKARFLQAWLDHREIQKLVPQVMNKYVAADATGRRGGLLSLIPGPRLIALRRTIDDCLSLAVMDFRCVYVCCHAASCQCDSLALWLGEHSYHARNRK
jgi:hypothetical protein